MCLSALRICKRMGRRCHDDDIILGASAPIVDPRTFPTLPRSYGSGAFLDANYTFTLAQRAAATMALSPSITIKDFAIAAPEKEKMTRQRVRKERREEVLGERRELGIVMGDIFASRISADEEEIEKPVAVAVKDDGLWSEAEFDAHMGSDNDEPIKKLVLLPRGKTTLRKQDIDLPGPLRGVKPTNTLRNRPLRSLYIPEDEIIHRTQFLKNNLARNRLLEEEIAKLEQFIKEEKKIVLEELDHVLARNEYVMLMIKLSKKDKVQPPPQEFWVNVHFRLKQHAGYDKDTMVKWAHVQVAMEMVASFEEEMEDNRLLIQADRKVLANAAYADAKY